MEEGRWSLLLRSYSLKDRFPNILNTDNKSFCISNKSLYPPLRERKLSQELLSKPWQKSGSKYFALGVGRRDDKRLLAKEGDTDGMETCLQVSPFQWWRWQSHHFLQRVQHVIQCIQACTWNSSNIYDAPWALRIGTANVGRQEDFLSLEVCSTTTGSTILGCCILKCCSYLVPGSTCVHASAAVLTSFFHTWWPS